MNPLIEYLGYQISKYSMKRGSTLFLRLAIIVIGLVALLFCVFLVPSLGSDVIEMWPALHYIRYVIMAVSYLSVIPFFIILIQGWRLLNFIDKNTAFSQSSVKALSYIKYSAVAIGVLYAIYVPSLFYPLAQADDAPGLIIFGMIIAGTPFVFAVFTAVLKRLLQNAIEFKSENELTV